MAKWIIFKSKSYKVAVLLPLYSLGIWDKYCMHHITFKIEIVAFVFHLSWEIKSISQCLRLIASLSIITGRS